jgi:hypothetical protein
MLFHQVIITPRLNTAGCSMETLQPVSIIALLEIPKISTEPVHCSSKMEHGEIAAASSGALSL